MKYDDRLTTAIDVCPGSVRSFFFFFFFSFKRRLLYVAFIFSHSAVALHPSLFQLYVGCFSPPQNQRRPAPVVLQCDAGAALLDQKLHKFQMAARSRVPQHRPSSIYRCRFTGRSDHRIWTGGGLWLPCSVQEPGIDWKLLFWRWAEAVL